MNQSAIKPAIGFIGLGIMGAAMAARLAAAGYPLHVYNRTRAKAAPLIEVGASWHATPKALAEATDVIITIVGMPDDVRALYLGDDGLIANARRDAVLIDMTTSSPQLAEELAVHAAASGVHMLDAPVSGGDVGAREGRLSIMVGGAADVLARVEPILRHLGSKIVLQGGPGAGQHTKLCNQIVIASTMLGVCEGLAYAHSAGLDAQTVLSAIGGGAAGGFQLNNLGPRIAKGDFAPGFFIEHFIKDMRIAHEEAAHMGRELPGLNLVRSLYQKLAEEGFTRNGTQALFKLYER
ncbi:NAD-binding of NADP-dependent 3-hydroxyisobutyrate dehydrogenase family protein [Paraburkholderia fungorum]|jgi:3-hydroxyisobutyrate dehydrogenase|uniref:3-hydroxyisobutyrate dehydrogenase n=1 Tax=Paraburkholderia fungorum TaxID=134537 RepID=A0AAJ3VR04_9BURK|nr:NAD(P)-dependent oxidoreductase [Paraburkholderia fungorum]AJZ63264.1 NAD-binding of NADP-dependent 3-hydroxyisobutyrate dehydrogenase family protein [Paraburkholderia fungorum]MBB4512376.1 3-hydroxyisobutyrate dehydrogenase [Paraburkholderia fungorum]MBB5540016.1 3-hydroxyisobutyrate dehydrogenase [Paraburkholderia fungorum]MBB6200282.1 3-hydroxyisobutyrate dehydrogenase [Paraburkholderia fungorum]MBU7438044.1 NAD(P)-dependent oxidoreductase [Paraburkholderia fungorum]